MCINIYVWYQTVYAICIFPLSFIVSANLHIDARSLCNSYCVLFKKSQCMCSSLDFFSFVGTIGATMNKFLFLKINYFNWMLIALQYCGFPYINMNQTWGVHWGWYEKFCRLHPEITKCPNYQHMCISAWLNCLSLKIYIYLYTYLLKM